MILIKDGLLLLLLILLLLFCSSFMLRGLRRRHSFKAKTEPFWTGIKVRLLSLEYTDCWYSWYCYCAYVMTVGTATVLMSWQLVLLLCLCRDSWYCYCAYVVTVSTTTVLMSWQLVLLLCLCSDSWYCYCAYVVMHYLSKVEMCVAASLLAIPTTCRSSAKHYLHVYVQHCILWDVFNCCLRDCEISHLPPPTLQHIHTPPPTQNARIANWYVFFYTTWWWPNFVA